jgi:hypothetical protein
MLLSTAPCTFILSLRMPLDAVSLRTASFQVLLLLESFVLTFFWLIKEGQPYRNIRESSWSLCLIVFQVTFSAVLLSLVEAVLSAWF